MGDNHRTGAVYWLDHYVVPTNNLLRWRDFQANILGGVVHHMGGLSTRERLQDSPLRCFMEIREPNLIGGFLQDRMLPPSEGLGKGLPRYGYFINAEDIDEHLHRLEEFDVPHTGPIRTSEEGQEGAAIYFEDPDGNQMEFWAPTHMPEGAVDTLTTTKVGRISHVVQECRELGRTAEFYSRYCGIDMIEDSDIPKDTLALQLLGGGRMVFKHVDQLCPRSGGPNKWFGVHTALTVREDEYITAYTNLWEELGESKLVLQSPEAREADESMLPPQTFLHPKISRGEWENTLGRGTSFSDWDINHYHLVGGTPVNGSMAYYLEHSADGG